MDSIEPIEWRGGSARFLDQTRLPGEVVFVETRDYRDLVEAIRGLAVRGAPLIGIAAGYALALAARRGEDLTIAGDALVGARPTAVNLRWAVERCIAAAHGTTDAAASIEAEAARIHAAQIADDKRMGEIGAALIDDGATVLTHCNAGGLATGGIGTALGVIKTAHRQGKRIDVLVGETRPLLQGARLTAWELAREGIPHRIIVDAAAAGLIARGEVRCVITGADRIAANGDVANKVGTYGLALAARAHDVPLYVAAPRSTIDAATPDGASVIIEQRPEEEIVAFGAMRVAPDGARALNPAFDVTPAEYVRAIVTECGVLRAPLSAAIARLREADAVVAR